MAARERYSGWVNGTRDEVHLFIRCDECVLTVFSWSAQTVFGLNALADAVRNHEKDWHTESSEA